MITAPVTKGLCEIFKRHGLDPAPNDRLIADLMRYVYDQREEAVDVVLGERLGNRIDRFHDQVHGK